MSETKHITRTIITSTLTLAVWASALAQDLPFTLTEVGPNVWAAIGGANPATGSNAGFVIGDDGVVVIDTFASAAGARQLLAEIRRRTKLPVRFVVNTHHHLDHAAGNAVFIEAGALVLAHRNVHGWIRPDGGLGRAVDVTAFREYLATLRRLVSDARERRFTGDALAATVRPTLAKRYGQWDFFEYLAAPNILQTEEELNGTKRVPR